jgi:endonuclease/exonuclease/phosphatase family metal-dependent hydrolase
MTQIKIGTFNTENLFLRYTLLDKSKGSRSAKPLQWDKLAELLEKREALIRDPLADSAETERIRKELLLEVGFGINDLGANLEEYGPVSKRSRKLTAQVILENNADVLAVQEVESLYALEDFNREFLKGSYPFCLVIDGNDPRNIDVGILSKFPIGAIRTHRYSRNIKKKPLFSRDCLEVEILIPDAEPIFFYVNHFKSKIGGGEDKRLAQSTEVAKIINERFGSHGAGRYVVLGDLNSGPEGAELEPLLNIQGLENVIERLPHNQHWTHYYKKDKKAEQLDYLLVSQQLIALNENLPYIERRGLGQDINIYTGKRFDSTIKGKDGASDHCAVFMALDV